MKNSHMAELIMRAIAQGLLRPGDALVEIGLLVVEQGTDALQPNQQERFENELKPLLLQVETRA